MAEWENPSYSQISSLSLLYMVLKTTDFLNLATPRKSETGEKSHLKIPILLKDTLPISIFITYSTDCGKMWLQPNCKDMSNGN